MLVKIAIPVVDGRLAGHFGETKTFAVVEADPQSRAIVSTEILAAPRHEPGSIPRWLRGQGVQILIVGENGIGRRALDYLLHHAIEVLAGRSGAAVGSLIAASLEGRLTRMQGGCNEQREPAAKSHDCRLADYFEGQTGGDVSKSYP
jgi:predicted Fe-Mo cluster-binding NifX family protein